MQECLIEALRQRTQGRQPTSHARQVLGSIAERQQRRSVYRRRRCRQTYCPDAFKAAFTKKGPRLNQAALVVSELAGTDPSRVPETVPELGPIVVIRHPA